MFVTLEGMEGSGKTTQIRALERHYSRAGWRVFSTREPGGTRLGEELRALLLERRDEPVDPSAELFLMEAARAQHVAAVLRRAIAENDLVLCDRYADASLAYQGGGRGLDADFIRRANRFATGGLVPDLTVLLDMDPGAAVGRALARNKREKDPADRFEREEVPFHERVRRAYLELAHREPGRFLVLPAARAPEEIEREIIGRIDRGLAGKRA